MSTYKRRRKVLTIEQKLQAVERLSKGESISEVALDLGVGVATVSDWRHKKEDLENWCAKYATNEQCRNRKCIKDGDFEEVGEALFRWFTERKEKNRPVESHLLKEKARAFYKELQEDENVETKKFFASTGWLKRWRSRYGIKTLAVPANDEDGKPKQRRARRKKRKFVNRLVDMDLRKIRGDLEDDDDDDDDGAEEKSEEKEVERVVSHRCAVYAFDTAILYLEQQQKDAVENIEIALLRRLRDVAALKHSAAAKKARNE